MHDQRAPGALADACASTSTGWTACVHSIGFAPAGGLQLPRRLVGRRRDGPARLGVLAESPSASRRFRCMGAGGSIVGLTFDAQYAWPVYDWMGVAKAAFESTARYLARDLGPKGIRVNLVVGRPDPDDGGQVDPGLRGVRGQLGRAGAAGLGRRATPSRPRAPASRCCPTGSRRPPARSCTSTAACTRWGTEAARGMTARRCSSSGTRSPPGHRRAGPRAAAHRARSARGAAAGRLLAAAGPRPDLVVCSAATRGPADLAARSSAWPDPPPVRVEHRLYDASRSEVLAVVNETADDVAGLACVGHEPTSSAWSGCWPAPPTPGRGRPGRRARRPPARPCCVFDGEWSDLQAGAARLARVVAPR